ncbi:MAG TPA: protein kinase [Symbiobacteriaceae bacterium]|jgi:serine/threonine protein kinase|nr:protein kinase [Symbiobacteriaceae bacterium]
MDLTTVAIRAIEGRWGTGLEGYESIRLLHEPVPECLSLIFEAVDTRSGRPVVLKFLHPRLENPYWHASFAREESLLLELAGHPHVIALYERRRTFHMEVAANGVTGVPLSIEYLALERGDIDLRAYIRSDEPEPSQALRLFRDLCHTVACLHRRGIFHRDLKPANCVLTQNRSLRLIDFACAYRQGDPRLAGREQFAVRYALPITDHKYAALELFCGLGRDPAMFAVGDVFSLGATLYELWTGRFLTEDLYDRGLVNDLGELFYRLADENKRLQNYQKAVAVLKRKWPLPDLREASVGRWAESAQQIHHLYSRMAALDYAERCSDFAWILHELDRLIDVVTPCASP